MLMDYNQLLSQKGISLSALGIQDIALMREDAQLAVDLLSCAKLPILGGDVYFSSSKGIEQAYANWYTERQNCEEWTVYLQRSWEDSFRYIRDFPQQTD